jgi:hypothetical protein
MLFHVCLRQGIVYVPTVARRDGGPYTDIEPVGVVPVANTEGIRRALMAAIARGNITVPVPKGKWPAPVFLKYAGVRTWSAFARGASSWSIEEKDGKYQIDGYRKHPKGYWVEDPEQRIILPAGATVNDVIDRMIAILEDAAQK